MSRAEWEQLFHESKLRTRVHAVADRIDTTVGAFGYACALAMHDIPVLAAGDDRIDLILSGRNTRHSAPDLHRHHCPLPERDVVELPGGIRVTSLSRTIFDVSRLLTLEGAVVAFDAALRRIAWSEADNLYDRDAAAAFRADVASRIAEATGARGIRQARFVAEFADGRAQLPGESLLRLRMWQAHLPEPAPQLRVNFAEGDYALLDLALPSQRRWLEFDGAVKYRDPDMLAGRTAEEVLEAQERRHRRIELATGWRGDRVVWADVRTVTGFASAQRRLSLFP